MHSILTNGQYDCGRVILRFRLINIINNVLFYGNNCGFFVANYCLHDMHRKLNKKYVLFTYNWDDIGLWW